jgi:glycosyltransferase involved in cell wall biosynthesis
LKNNILFLLKLPPPITGATLSNKLVYESTLLSKHFNIRRIPISYSKSLNELGRIKISKIYVFLLNLLKLLNELLLHRPELVYFQISPLGIAFYRDIMFVIITKLFRTKILFHLHGKGIKEASKTSVKRLCYKSVFNGSTVICLSNLLTDDIKDIYKGKIYIVNNGIPDIELAPFNQSIRNKNGIINILFLSNLIKSKGITDFIEALKILNKKNINFKAHIVGAEGDFSIADLQVVIQETDLSDKIVYFGALYGMEKYKIVFTNEILVFPTKNDVWGNVILEAMQCGLPVIATREGAIPEVIDDGITGFLVDKNSPAQIADKIEILVKNPDLIEAMGKAARKKYEK